MPSPRFTPENAREFALKSCARRKILRAERIAAEAQQIAARELAAEKARQIELDELNAALPKNSYLRERVLCVRQHIQRVSGMIDVENDAQRLERLAAALSKLEEIERNLCGRPLPGSRRPPPERRKTVEPRVINMDSVEPIFEPVPESPKSEVS